MIITTEQKQDMLRAVAEKHGFGYHDSHDCVTLQTPTHHAVFSGLEISRADYASDWFEMVNKRIAQ